MDKQGKRQACGSGDSLFCRFRTADCTLLTLRQPSCRSSFGKANAFIPIRHAFSSHFWSVRRILHDKGRIWKEKWEGKHRIIVRIVSFCVMFRKCVPDKWGSSYSSRPQMGRKIAANSTRRVCCAGHEVKSGRKWMKKGEFGRKQGTLSGKFPSSKKSLLLMGLLCFSYWKLYRFSVMQKY